MITLSWTSRVDASDSSEDPDYLRIDRKKLWHALLGKAEDPVGYVPAITACRIIERYDDGFLREIIRNGEKLVQRVSWEAEERIVFRHVDDPDVSSIANVVKTDSDGRLTFTIEVELTAGRELRSLSESEFLRDTDAYFGPTLVAILDALRPLAATSS